MLNHRVRMRRFLGIGVVMAAAATVAAAGANETRPPARSLIAGCVLDHENRPVEGARVGVASHGRGHLWYVGGAEGFNLYGRDLRTFLFFKKHNGKATASSTTGANGRFELFGLSKGAFRLIAYHAERGCTIIENVDWPKTGTELAIRLDAPTFLTGTVRGLPEQGQQTLFGLSDGAWIHGYLSPVIALDGDLDGVLDTDLVGGFISAPLTFDAQGSFRTGPLPGKTLTWTLSITQYVPANGYSAPLLETTARTQPGETSRFAFDFTRGESIAGTVLGPDKKPLPNVSVTVRTKRGVVVDDDMVIATGSKSGAVTDANGNYRIGGLEPGEFVLEAKRWIKRTGPG